MTNRKVPLILAIRPPAGGSRPSFHLYLTNPPTELGSLPMAHGVSMSLAEGLSVGAHGA